MDRKSFKMNKPGGKKNPKQNFKNAGFIALLILFGLIIFTAVNQPSTLKEVSFSDLVNRANQGQVKKIEISGSELSVTKQGEDKPSEKSRKEEGTSIYEQGLNKDSNVEIVNKQPSNSGH